MQDGTFDERFLRLPERVIVLTMQSHQRYFPLGGNRFAFVANGGDPDVVRHGQRVRAARAAGGRGVHVRARRRGRDRGAREARRLDHVPEGRGLVRGQDAAPRRARPRARRRRARRRGGAPLESGPGIRARARVPGARGPHRRDLRCARRAAGRGHARDRRAVPAGLGRRTDPAHNGRARGRGGRQARPSRDRVRPRARAYRLTRPVRAPAGRDRPQPARDRRRRARAARAARRRAGVRRGPPGRPPRRAGRVRARGARIRGNRPRRGSLTSRARCTRRSARTSSRPSTRRSTARTGSRASATTQPTPSTRARSSTTPSESSTPHCAGALSSREISTTRCAARPRSRPSSRASSTM